MGKLVVTIGVRDQQGRQFEDLEVTVDTGSTFTAVPRALLQRREDVSDAERNPTIRQLTSVRA